jgi:hypothetical protein
MVYMPLILKAESLSILKWWVGEAYVTPGDCRGQTGAAMLMGFFSSRESQRGRK